MVYLIFAVIYVGSLIGVHLVTKKKYKVVKLTEINSLLSEILQTNFKNSSLSNAAQSILIVLQRFYNIDYVTILIFHEAHNKMDIIASNVDSRFLKYIDSYCNTSFKNLMGKSAKVQTSHEGTLAYSSAEEREVCFSSFTPLVYQDKVIGAILLENKSNDLFTNKDNRFGLYDKVFNSTALVLQNVIYTENLISMTSTDQLTGVYNRRYIDMTLGEQLNIHRNLGMSFSVAIFDIDKFKVFNDTHGHQFGDIVLKEVASFMKQNLGDNSWVARYGGEEFVLFFGRSEQVSVFNKVDELREGLSNLKLTDGETVTSVTASFGIATFPNVNGSVNDIIKRADDCLYESKKNGRNRVTMV